MKTFNYGENYCRVLKSFLRRREQDLKGACGLIRAACEVIAQERNIFQQLDIIATYKEREI